MAFSFSGGSAENIRPRPPLREDFAVIREEPNLRIAFTGSNQETYEVERIDAQGNATTVGSADSPDILVPSRAQKHRVVAKNKELGIKGTPSVPKTELKPTHRWQMPQPRNLLPDPESFDPANTAWRVQNGLAYDGVTPNVGPNGEDADTFTFPGDSFTPLRVLPTVNTVTTGGFYLRVDSGSKNLVLVTREQDNTIHTNNSSIGTSWRWLSLETPNDIGLLRLQSNDLDAATVYILRAVLNRGSSRLFSTRSQVPQTIPDVVQGADLSNGSTDGPDTNDLSFGVDSQGVPFAVSDGDDKLSKIPSSILGDQTWIWSIRAPDGGYTEAFTTGRTGYFDWGVQPGSGAPNIFLNVETEDGLKDVNIAASFPFDGAVAISIDRNAGEARLNVEGTVKTIQFSEIARGSFNDWSPWVKNTGGIRLSHLEAHPVLTPAEAEAVRQRLAENPADPVPPTEAWDFTAETSPHNLLKQSENIDPSAVNEWGTTNASVTQNAATDPDGGTSAEEVSEDSNTQTHGIFYNNPPTVAGGTHTYSAWVKPINENWVWIDAFQEISAWFDIQNGVLGSYVERNGSYVDHGMKEVGGGWYRIWLTFDSTKDKVNFAVLSATQDLETEYAGDGSSVFYVWGAQVVRGDAPSPTYTKTTDTIAFPQTVPALRDSSNDLTLGSTSGADTSDPSWVAPIGLVGDGSDDKLSLSSFHNAESSVTWVLRHELRLIAGDRKSNGWDYFWDGSGFKLSIRDINKDQIRDKGSDPGWAEGEKHVLAVVIDFTEQTAHLYGDTILSPLASVDFSTLSELQSGRFPLHRFGLKAKTSTHAHVYTRALTDEEALYARQRILDNPQPPHPEYTNP